MKSPEEVGPLETIDDHEAHWNNLMRPLGFTRSTLWLTVLDQWHNVMSTAQIEDCPDVLTQEDHRQLSEFLGHFQPPEVGGLALLYSRSGGPVTDQDREWVRRMYAIVDEAGQRVPQIFIATDTTLQGVTRGDEVIPEQRAG